MTCDRCGVKIVRGDYYRSRFTGNRYCVNLKECDKRKDEKKRR